MSAATATVYVRRMVELETRGNGDIEGAMRRLGARFGLPFWSLWHLRRGRAKTIDAELFGKIKVAYLSYCERQIKILQDEVAAEKAIAPDADLESLEAAAVKLAAKIEAAKARRAVKP